MPILENEGRVAVVGAGLVGSLLSILLAKKGYTVDVYERRPDMRKERISAGRSVNLAISTRGLFALRQAGVEEEILAQAIPMRGRMIHPRSGSPVFQRYGKDDRDAINSLSRGILNQVLMTRAEETGRVRIHFNERVTGLDSGRGELEFHDERTGETRGVATPRVFGTDGSASALRSRLPVKVDSGNSQEILSSGYKELSIPAGPGGAFQLEKNALHIWPRGSFMLIALPNQDGSFTCTLFLPFEGPESFRNLETPESVREFFATHFPDVANQIEDLEKVFFSHPTGQMVTVKCSPWNVGGELLLLGDAAHAIVPFFGQGMNCGFEDCSVLDRMISPPGQGTRWTEVFAGFSKSRKPHTDAIADMAVENFLEMRDKTADPRFLFEKEVEKILQKEFPGEYVSRYALVTFSRVPYRIAYEAGLIQGAILTELCHGLTQPEEVNLKKAAELIRVRLTPFMKQTESQSWI